MIRNTISLWIKVLFALEVSLFSISTVFLLLIDGFEKNIGFTLAHISGILTILILSLLLSHIIENKSVISTKAFIFSTLSVLILIMCYLAFFIEKISPIIHSGVSFNFDIGTDGFAIAMMIFINIIKKIKGDKK